MFEGISHCLDDVHDGLSTTASLCEFFCSADIEDIILMCVEFATRCCFNVYVEFTTLFFWAWTRFYSFLWYCFLGGFFLFFYKAYSKWKNNINAVCSSLKTALLYHLWLCTVVLSCRSFCHLEREWNVCDILQLTHACTDGTIQDWQRWPYSLVDGVDMSFIDCFQGWGAVQVSTVGEGGVDELLNLSVWLSLEIIIGGFHLVLQFHALC